MLYLRCVVDIVGLIEMVLFVRLLVGIGVLCVFVHCVSRLPVGLPLGVWFSSLYVCL